MQLRNPVTRILLGGLAGLLGALNGWAQTAGTVSVSGSVSPVVRLTSGGAATLTGNSGGGVTTQSAANAPLATIVNFGDVGPGNTSSFVCFTQPLFLRSNTPSSLKAALTANTFGGAASDLQATDVGIGLRNLTVGGVNADISNTTIVAAYAADPCAAPLNVNGVPTYSRSLSNLGTVTPGTTMMSATGAWSLRGSLTSPSNLVRVDLKLAIVPQSFATGSFSATVTLTVTSP